MPMPGADCAVAECAAAAPPPPAPVPGGAPPPQQQQQQQQAQQQPQQQKVPESSQQFADQAGSTGATSGSRDYTQVPAQMDQRFEKLDTDNSLRPTIISAAERCALIAIV